MSLNTLNDVFFYTAVERNLDRAMLHVKKEHGCLSRRPSSAAMLPEPSADCRSGAFTRATALRYSARIAPMVHCRLRHSHLLGAVTRFPHMPTLTPEQTAFTLRDSAATVVFVSTEHQLRKVQAILSQNSGPENRGHGIVLRFPASWPANCVLMNRFMTQGQLTLDPKPKRQPDPSSPTT